jgi:hypothetical protein
MTNSNQGHRGAGPGGGQFLNVTHGTSPVSLPSAGRDRFPHPDTAYPHPMEQWPEGVEDPQSIELGTIEHQRSHTNNPAVSDYSAFPGVTITMANGATLALRKLDDGEFPETEAEFDGDWDAYTGGDRFKSDEILSTASETLCQAR